MQKEDHPLVVLGAREHNLKNIDLTIPRNRLTVITGLSGSGKSSLAFDTIYKEGQRRYLETMSAYARHFIGKIERPDVDKITGLSPVISIEQKSIGKNPRSTVGTVTEIYDFLRLLYARAGEAYSYKTGEKMIKYTNQQIIDLILKHYEGKKIYVMSPLVQGRKGHYKELFEQYRKRGFLNVRIDGEYIELTSGLKIDRYKTHFIELVIDKLKIDVKQQKRIKESVGIALEQGKGVMMVIDKESGEEKYFSKKLMCPTTGIAYSDPAPYTFSFNSPRGACPRCKGLGYIKDVAIDILIPDQHKSIKKGAIKPIGAFQNRLVFWQIEAVLKKYHCTLDTPVKDIPQEAMDIILYGTDRLFTLENTPLGKGANYTVSFNGILDYLSSFFPTQTNDHSSNKRLQKYFKSIDCPECQGQRLNKEALSYKIGDKNIADLSNMDLNDLFLWFKDIESKLNTKQQAIAEEILKELRTRLTFLLEVGLDYLSLNRPARTLSGGESQRIRLATQIGSQLVNVLYILDEPSIGLHNRDNNLVINSLKHLRDIGNSVIVVEHDKDMILASDHIVDMGPMAGKHGGEVVAEGEPRRIESQKTLTGDYLSGRKKIIAAKKRRKGNGHSLVIKKARGNNLKDIDVEFPLGKFICITGVSGSGKSSLINQTLYPILNQHIYNSLKEPLPYDELQGIDHINKVIEVDQSFLGKSPRSNPVTYTGIFTEIRKLFEQTPEAKIRGYTASRFSFNVKGGRCEECKGAGLQNIEMNFLPDVYVTCKTCHGKRYNKETLQVTYKGKNISDVLNLTINQAVDCFENLPQLYNKLKTLQEVGLGYITLGQPSTTLSGGESQRVKLASELGKKSTGKTLYILDEPTTGLHFEDVKVLLDVLNKLVDKGNSIIVIEHNLEVIKVADHIIDLGKEGGRNGGYVLTSGTPEDIIKCKDSYTAQAIREASD